MSIPAPRLLWTQLLNLVYPACCAGCDQFLLEGEEVLCLSCFFRLPTTAFHQLAENSMQQKLSARFPVEQATAFLYFSKTGLAQRLIHGFKYKQQSRTGRFLARQFGEALHQSGWLHGVDYLIPVPLHRRKERGRGFNQARTIAEEIGNAGRIPVLNGVLIKVRHTESQTYKSVEERLDNVKDAFRLQKPEGLEDRTVLLVDDVLTTGATIEACALTLTAVPDIRIRIATLAFAVND